MKGQKKMDELSVMKKLLKIQNELKVPKNNYNEFGGFEYRSAEDILVVAKPIAAKYECLVTLSDDIVMVGTRYYVKATATLYDTETNQSVTAVANAREPENKKGMDEMQITGSASSYSRKYALNGLFSLDDHKDSDFSNNTTPVTPDLITDVQCKIIQRYYKDDNMQQLLVSKNIKELSEMPYDVAKDIVEKLKELERKQLEKDKNNNT